MGRRIDGELTRRPKIDPPDFFSSAHLAEKGPSGTILRFLRYPPRSDIAGGGDGDIRAGAHSDYGSITLYVISPTFYPSAAGWLS